MKKKLSAYQQIETAKKVNDAHILSEIKRVGEFRDNFLYGHSTHNAITRLKEKGLIRYSGGLSAYIFTKQGRERYGLRGAKYPTTR